MANGFKWKHQHTALAAVFMVWMVSYLDRMVMSTAIPYIATEFKLSPVEMGAVMSAFFAGYALCQIPGGILSDKFGARKVMTFSIIWWSIFTGITGMMGSLASMIWIRVLFGIGEGLAPAATWKSLAIWTPQKKRGWANGIMMCTNSLGPALAPLFVIAIMAAWGWRTVFYALTIPGVILALWVWFKMPDNPAEKKGIDPEELAELTSEQPKVANSTAASSMTFWQVFAVPAVWKTFVILFFSNTACWGFTTWVPSYLVKAHGFQLTKMGIVASLPFFAGTIGALLAGWLLDGYFKNNRRYQLILGEVCAALFLYLTYTATSTTAMIIYQTITGFFMYFCVITVFSLPMAAIPGEIAGRAMGIVNTAGQIAGFLAPITVGALVITNPDGTQGFTIAFGYLVCTALIAAFLSIFYKQRREESAAD